MTHDERIAARLATIPDWMTAEDLRRAYARTLVRCDMLDADNLRIRNERERLALVLVNICRQLPAALALVTEATLKIANKAIEKFRARAEAGA